MSTDESNANVEQSWLVTTIEKTTVNGDTLESVKAERWPVDYDNLTKGTFISSADVERIIAVKRSDYRAYGLAMLGLKQRIEDEMAERGRPIVLKSENDGLRVLTDSEAVDYAAQRHRNLSRQMVRNHVKTVAAVDPRQLTAEELRRHERNVISRSRELQALQDTRHAISFEQKNQKKLPDQTR